MRIISAFFLVIAAGLLCLQCSGPIEPVSPGTPPVNQPGITAAEKQVLEASNRFGLRLFNEIATGEEPTENIFISPLSVSMALGMTYNGAAGETQTAMASTLELANLTPDEINQSYRKLIDLLTQLDPAVAFSIANSIWYRDGFPIAPEFIDLNQTYFDAAVRGLDFSQPWAADTINHWVDVSTNGKITEIVKAPIPWFIVMYLINAVYFNGDWTLPFDTSVTEDMFFMLQDGSMVMRPTMQTDTLLQYYENDLFQAVDLAYGNGDFSMAVLLPQWDVTPNEIIAQMTPENWSAWVGAFSEEDVQLGLPKFKLRYDKELKEILAAMGMAIAFDGDNADFSNMVTSMELLPGNLYIDFVKHKTFVQVDEVGTQAAAVTVIGMGITGIEPGKKYMSVNRPFIVVIHEHESGSILFLGKIVDPVWEE